MPWINLTLRRGALPKPVQHAVMAKLTEVLMWWEKVPSTPTARKIMKGWVYEVAEDADYNAGSPDHEKPFYFVEIRIPINRLDLLAKQGLIRDFTRVVLQAEGSDNTPCSDQGESPCPRPTKTSPSPSTKRPCSKAGSKMPSGSTLFPPIASTIR
jgi:phenylpyruvate tautomerase PptA (4-oxalocrotonate tautomerase family)